MSERYNEQSGQTEQTEKARASTEQGREGPDSSVRQDRPDLNGKGGDSRPENAASYRTMELRPEDRLSEMPPRTLELRPEDMTRDAMRLTNYAENTQNAQSMQGTQSTQSTENTASGGMSGPNATSSPGRSEAPPVQTDDPRVKPPEQKPPEQKPPEQKPPEQKPPEKKGPDGRTDTDVRKELEKRTGKSYGELVVGLGKGPIDPAKISPRDVERELVNNGTLRPTTMDTKEPVVIDNVLTPHPYQPDRFVTEGRVGPESKIDADKAAGQQAVRDAATKGIAQAVAGTKPGAASEGLVKPAPEQRRYEPRPPTTYEPRQGAHHPEPPKWGGLGPQGPEKNSQLTAPRVVTGEIKTQNSADAAKDVALTKWAAQHPDTACVAVVTYDAHGNLSMDVYLAGGNQDLVWHNDNIGHVDPSQLPKEAYQSSAFGTKIEPAVTKYVGEYLGQHFQAKSGNATGPDFVPGRPVMKFNLMTK
ncbi:hypothetical protein DMA15_31000 [Streptomyces sp. WAC 01529]|uniref:hypothetical protein n=1 Tax=Streptomyces sp. WAC 01529 TaxID=2203205 RepID=UPI000F71589D|nr:hypothetical protein [Streptomyces sp. WAC 01529]AZM56462.1 hypothetical protein DMA15_31000 [Streptomyces sp. WAC 01529]